MLSWILTSSAIAAFSAATLELFRESGNSALAGLTRTRAWSFQRQDFHWEKMSDAELDQLLEEFNQTDTEVTPNDRTLAA